MTSPRRILALHLSCLLLASLGSCQFEDDNAADLVNSGDDNIAKYSDTKEADDTDAEEYDGISAEENDGEVEDEDEFVDSRIDESPTYVSGVERFIKALMAPFDWLGRATSAARESDKSADADGQQGRVNVGRSIRNGFGDVLNSIGDRFKAIYPGTEWCGAGSIAKTSKEVGLFQRTDRCCRAHDHCNINLNAGVSEYGLRNNGIFTRSHCLCDANFYHCLKEANTLVSRNIGYTYFNILRPQCFKEEYPAYCVKYGRNRLRNNKCLSYDYDYSKNKTWQWFDSPDFQ